MIRVRVPVAVPEIACQGCAHFDKSGWPDNPAFGKCRAPLPELPPLPMWFVLPKRQDSNVAYYYDASRCALRTPIAAARAALALATKDQP